MGLMPFPKEFEGIPNIIKRGPYLVYHDGHQVCLPGGTPVRLTPRLYDIFSVLSFDEGKKADIIIDEVYKANLEASLKSKFVRQPRKMNEGLLHTHINHLRQALGFSAIINTHGYYRLNISPT